MLISGMQGLGDNIYQRSLLREIPERIHLRTSFPQVYSDLDHIKPVKPNTRLRTQKKNIEKQDENLWNACPSLPMIKLTYTINDLKHRSILESMSKRLGGVIPKIFDIPKFEGPKISRDYAVIRPVTIRAEWPNFSRGPETKYINQATEILKKHGLCTVSVADLQDNLEWTSILPNCSIKYNKGELSFCELMGLIQNATLVVGGVGWIFPAAIAAGVPLICILGGLGAFNAPEKIASKPMDTSKTKYIFPDNYCMCNDMLHACDKNISNFEGKFKECLKAL